MQGKCCGSIIVMFLTKPFRQWWMPDTGGANIPDVNDLLSPWGIALGDRVFEGDFNLGGHSMYYASGTSLTKFPADGIKVWRSLKDQSSEVLNGETTAAEMVPIMGLYQPAGPVLVDDQILNSLSQEDGTATAAGRIIVYGDSNCLDNSHMQKGISSCINLHICFSLTFYSPADCFWMLDAMVDYAMSGGDIPTAFLENPEGSIPAQLSNDPLPQRMDGNQLHRYSKVLEPLGQKSASQPQARPLPSCPQPIFSLANPLNKSAPTNLYQSQKLLSLGDPQFSMAPLKKSNSNFQEMGDTMDLNSPPVSFHYSKEWSTSTKVALIVMSVIALILFYQFYKHRSRPRRRKSPRSKRVTATANLSPVSVKPPTV